jgi:protein-L-isoaspartate(D-aspartate) O-methyltransferase
MNVKPDSSLVATNCQPRSRQHNRRAKLFQALCAALVAAAVATPVGAAETDPATARMRMVDEQLRADARGIADPAVLKAMATVPRHEFVPAKLSTYAYEDRPLPIGHGQTISQPYIVAFMTEKLQAQPNDRVLEIGTGSGYQAAILSGLVREVYSIEIVEALASRAAGDLARLGYGNIRVRHGDGYQGWPEAAPFDAIIVTCAPDHVPQPLIDQLRDGGRMVIPVGEPGEQNLYLLRKRGAKLEREAILPVRFVPMTGAAENERL